MSKNTWESVQRDWAAEDRLKLRLFVKMSNYFFHFLSQKYFNCI